MQREQRLFFCYYCGGKLVKTAEVRPRLRCSSCQRISYENPIVGVAGIIRNEQGEILLVRRAPGIDYAGLWCIPCGYLEYDEDVRAGLVREVLEETGLHVSCGQVFSVHSNFHNPRQHTVGIWFECEVLSGEFVAGDDADILGWFSLLEPPEMAFSTDRLVLAELLAAEAEGLAE